MKKSLRFGAAVSLIFGIQFAAAASAFAGTETGISDFIDDLCKPGVEDGTYSSVGECMGKNRQDVINYCKANYQALGFSTNGMCEKWAQERIHSKNYQ